MVTQHSKSLWAHGGTVALEERADGVRCLTAKNRSGYAEQISWVHQGAIVDAAEQNKTQQLKGPKSGIFPDGSDVF